MTIPPGQPQTKPKACNVGLFLARGEFLVIYDAEDRPEPDQLKAALVAFGRADERQVCVQAALELLQRRRKRPDQDVHPRVLVLVRLHAPGPRGDAAPDTARRDVQSLPHRRAATSGRLGPIQRDRGRRPRHPLGGPRRDGRGHLLHHVRGGQQRRTATSSDSGPAGSRATSRRPSSTSATRSSWSGRPGGQRRLALRSWSAGTPLSFLFVPPLYLLFAITMILGPQVGRMVLPRLGPLGQRRLPDRRQRHDDLRLDDGGI